MQYPAPPGWNSCQIWHSSGYQNAIPSMYHSVPSNFMERPNHLFVTWCPILLSLPHCLLPSHNCSRIYLIQHLHDWKSVRVSSILDYQTAPILTQVLTGNYFTAYVFWLQLIRGVFRLDISFTSWFRVIRVPFCVFWSLFIF